MTQPDVFPQDETVPIAGTSAPPSATPPQRVETTSLGGMSGSMQFPQPSTLPAPVTRPVASAVTTPAGWYPLNGEQRYWDGFTWTEHRAPAPAPVHRPAYYPPVVVTDARTNGVEVLIAWILTVVTLGYMLPWAIAATRGKSNSWAVGLLNFLLGWTFIGWVAALVMACMAHQVAVVHHRA